MQALFIPFAPSQLAVQRCLATAAAWQARGHQALFAVGEEAQALVEQAGFPVHSLPEISTASYARRSGYRWIERSYFHTNLEAEQRLIERLQPEVVVSAGRLTTPSAARLAGLPSVSIQHGNAALLAAWPFRAAQRLYLGVEEVNQGRRKWRRRLFSLVFQAWQQAPLVRLGPSLAAEARPRHELRLALSPGSLMLGDRVLLADLPALLPGEMPSYCALVGPLLPVTTRAEPAAEDPQKPVICLVCKRHSFTRLLLPRFIHALRDQPLTVCLCSDSAEIPPLPANFHLRQDFTFPAETRLVIHSGDHPILLQALAAGAPSLVIPANADQRLSALQVQALGLGRSLWQAGELPLPPLAPWRYSAGALRRAIWQILVEPAYAQACRELRRESLAYQGSALAAAEIERFVKFRQYVVTIL